MANVKKWDIIKAVSAETGIKQESVNAVLDATINNIVTECRDNGNDVNMPGLGVFKHKYNEARVGRNPKSGDALNIPASRTLSLRVSSSVKQVVETKKAKAKK